MHLTSIPDLVVEPGSPVETADAEWALARGHAGPRLLALVESGASSMFDDLEGEPSPLAGRTLLAGPLTPRNAAAVRRHLPWLTPRPLGLRTSAGLGDRLGLATPGHVRAVRSAGGALAPIFAQQSIREMTRTGRQPQQVLDDATWGAFGGGWRDMVGADADHLKTTDDIDACLAAGFSLFTIDPGAFVNPQADALVGAELDAALSALPWPALEDSASALRARYRGRVFDAEGHVVTFDDATLARAAVKYGGAVAHVAAMFRHLAHAADEGSFEVEVSVDETDSPTSPADHVYVATELTRLGVVWVSLAPRFVGRFEKGVDYIGDLATFEADIAVHAAIARALGPYKLSLHSGSDKFSIYPAAARQTHGLVHLKTAGTSYLEALRTIAALAPSLFREIYAFALDRYDTDRASYHVSAEAGRAPDAGAVADAGLESLVSHFDAREILHVTFGSVLTAPGPDGRPRFADRLRGVLRANPDAYASNLESHFVRHLRPFAGQRSQLSAES